MPVPWTPYERGVLQGKALCRQIVDFLESVVIEEVVGSVRSYKRDVLGVGAPPVGSTAQAAADSNRSESRRSAPAGVLPGGSAAAPAATPAPTKRPLPVFATTRIPEFLLAHMDPSPELRREAAGIVAGMNSSAEEKRASASAEDDAFAQASKSGASAASSGVSQELGEIPRRGSMAPAAGSPK